MPWGNGELWWVLEHESDTSQSLWRKDLRCGSSRGRACTHEYAHLSATHARTCTHTLQWAHVHMEELISIQPHTFSHTGSNVCVHTQTFSPMQADTLSVHFGTDNSCSHWYTTLDPLTRALTLKHRSAEQPPPAAHGRTLDKPPPAKL